MGCLPFICRQNSLKRSSKRIFYFFLLLQFGWGRSIPYTEIYIWSKGVNLFPCALLSGLLNSVNVIDLSKDSRIFYPFFQDEKATVSVEQQFLPWLIIVRNTIKSSKQKNCVMFVQSHKNKRIDLEVLKSRLFNSISLFLHVLCFSLIIVYKLFLFSNEWNESWREM